MFLYSIAATGDIPAQILTEHQQRTAAAPFFGPV